jgi:hypothetical protein
MPGTVALVAVDIAEADTVVVVAVGIAAEADIVALVMVGIAVFGTVVAGTAALAVPIVYPSSNLFRLPSDHLSTHPHPYPFHNLPLGIMGSHAFACILLPKMVLFRTL